MLFEDRRFRRFTAIYIVISIVLLIAIWFLYGALQKRIDKKYGNFTANILASYNEAEDADIEYYYDSKGIYESYSGVHLAFVKNRLIIIGSLFTVFLLLYIAVALYTKRIYRELENLTARMNCCLETDDVQANGLYEEGVIGRLEDAYSTLVSALRQNREKEKLDKEFLRDTLQDISHQLKTPIASMTVFNDLLMDNKIDSEEERNRILTENGRQLDRMDKLVKSMLKMARLDADSVIFDMQSRCLLDTIDMALSGISHRIIENNYTINKNCDKDIMLVHDADWLAEAFCNIITNAADHMDRDGVIDIDVSRNDICTRISIKDNGPGISGEELPHIFERFHKGANNTNPNSVGIGLALTKAIVMGQNGTVSVRSREGEYTEFIITFFNR